MVYIICNGINQGKTQKLLSIYHQIKKGDGFISLKSFSGELLVYNIMRLSNQETVPFICENNNIQIDWIEAFKYDKFSFSIVGLKFAADLINTLIIKKVSPIFIDEIGHVELQGKGLDELFKKVLKETCDIYVAIRKSCVLDVISKYNIRDYSIINVD